MNTAVLDAPRTYEEERGKPMPSENHGIVQSNLIVQFARHTDYRIISELSLDLNGRALTPDLSVYPRRPVDFRHDHILRTDPPLAIVEILSPTQGSLEVMEKIEAFLQSGVKSCWVINPPQRAITIYTPDGGLKTFGEGQVKDPSTGLTADMEAVFS